jgi:P-type E1-E2 ATPase
MEVVEVVTAPGIPAAALQRAVALLEARSEHPVGRSLARWAGDPVDESLQQLRTLPGRGVCGEHAGERWLAGSREWLEEEGLTLPAALATLSPGRWVHVGWGDAIRGAVRLTEELQTGTEDALQRLAAMDLSLHLLSGDVADNVDRLARALPVPVTAHGGLLPDGKIAALERLTRNGHTPLMVGDGINDAPALAAAPVGLAIAGGTDLTRAAADVVALHTDLGLVPDLLDLARRVHRTLVGNLSWAFAYNLVGVALAATGNLSPVFAASAMLVSSLLVIGNSLRLNRGPRAGGQGPGPAPSPGLLAPGL